MRTSSPRQFGIISALIAYSLGVFLMISCRGPSSIVSGIVKDADGPIAKARVRMRASEIMTRTTSDGSFILRSLPEGEEVEITAWADGYYIASTHVTPPANEVTLILRQYHTTDHQEYQWLSPIEGSSPDACGNCHPMIVPQWLGNAHGGAVSNPRFFSLYNGTDVTGAQRVDPGYQDDFPGTAGNCASCHAPGAGVDGYLKTNMNDVRDQITAGIHCDFCHKVGGAYMDPATDLPYSNMPGVVSMKVLRPPAGDNIFLGPYDDIHDPDTYLPEMSESQFCASCHQFSMWGTPIYQSYAEWLSSPYAERGVTCQDCHMPPSGDRLFAIPEEGGLEHPADTIPSHLQLGASDSNLLQNTVSMNVSAQQVGDQIEVTVTITNTDAGHHVPTDYPGRHMILVVSAIDEKRNLLTQVSGSVVASWGGSQAGMTGKAFAKVLRDMATGESPVVSYWNQTLIESDNRIPAIGSDTSIYSFVLSPTTREITIAAELFLRRAFQDVMDAKGWIVPDMLMEEEQIKIIIEDE
jgi:hypothetical protein